MAHFATFFHSNFFSFIIFTKKNAKTINKKHLSHNRRFFTPPLASPVLGEEQCSDYTLMK